MRVQQFNIRQVGKAKTYLKWDNYRNEFNIEIKNLEDNSKINFKFYDSVINYKNNITEADLKSALECFVLDVSSYLGARDLEDFIYSFGFEPKEGKKIFKACERNSLKADKISLDCYKIIEGLEE